MNDEQDGLSLSIQRDPLAVGALLDDLGKQRDQSQAWLLAIFRVAQKHFGDDAYRVDSDGFAAWLDQQIEHLAASVPPSVERLERSPDNVMDIYVPGAWKCLTCGFVLSQATIFVSSGDIGCSRDQVMKMTGEFCPNDGTEMVRVTWSERAEENQKWGESLMEEVISATGAEHLPGALEKLRSTHGVVVPPDERT